MREGVQYYLLFSIFFFFRTFFFTVLFDFTLISYGNAFRLYSLHICTVYTSFLLIRSPLYFIFQKLHDLAFIYVRILGFEDM